MKNTDKTAFTLVELLVVIAIISLLAGMLLPALSRGLRYARDVACINHEKQIGLAVMQYTDNQAGGYLPANYNIRGMTWDVSILPYLGKSDGLFGKNPFSYKADYRNIDCRDVLRCPFEKRLTPSGLPLRNYCINFWISGHNYYIDMSPTSAKIGEIRKPSITLLAGDIHRPYMEDFIGEKYEKRCLDVNTRYNNRTLYPWLHLDHTMVLWVDTHVTSERLTPTHRYHAWDTRKLGWRWERWKE